MALLFILGFGLTIGLAINFGNLHTDFMDLKDFHRGYMGRKMLIAEGRLASRVYLEALKGVLAEQKQANSVEGVSIEY